MNKYLRAISANFVFLALNTVFFLAITPLAIRVMGAEFYGLWTILYAIALFSNVGTLGIATITNKFSAEYSDTFIEHTNSVLTSGFIIVAAMVAIVSLVLLGTRGLIAGNINISAPMQKEFKLALFWIAIGLLPQFLSKVMQGYFLSQYLNTFVRSVEFLNSSLPWIGAVLLAITRKSLVVLAEWFFGTQLIVFLIYLVALQLRIRYRIRLDRMIFRKMLGFSKFMFLESMAIALFQQFDRVLVGLILGPVIAGAYAVGTSLGLRLPFITGQVTEIMIPYASTKDSLGDHQILYGTFRKMSQYIGFLAAVVGVILILFMDNILAIWISPAYAAQYSDIFRVIILAYSMLSLSRAGHQTLTGLGQVRFTSVTYLATTLVMLFSLVIFAKQWGVLGAAIANLSMVFLLTFNLQVYRSLSEEKKHSHILHDLGLPVVLLLIAFGLSLLFPSTLLKVVFVFALWMPLLVKLYRDKVFRLQINNFINRLGYKSS